MKIPSRARSIILVILAVAAWHIFHRGPGSTGPAVETGTGVETLFADRASGVMVEVSGRVDRLLADDREGSPHQRFILELPSGHTLLVAHNIDLAQRAPLSPGDPVELRGQYEWNAQGGVLHWTHDDPGGGHSGGWIRHQGKTYR